jgi:hypothetical protein
MFKLHSIRVIASNLEIDYNNKTGEYSNGKTSMAKPILNSFY